MKRIIISALTLTAIIITTPVLFAHNGKKGGRHRPGPPPWAKEHHKGIFFGDPEAMKEKLGLSEDQVEKIGSINLKYKKEFLKIKEKLAPKEIKLKSMLLEDNVNLNKVRSQLKDMAGLKVELRMLRIMQRLDIEKVLTSKQKAKLRNSRMGKRRMGPPPHHDMEP